MMAEKNTIPVDRYLWFWSLAVGGAALDLWTKAVVFAQPGLHRGSEWWLWTNHVGIQKSLNEGALFGMGQGNTWLFAVLAVAAAVGIPIWLFVAGAASDRWLTIALGAIMGGVFGNLYDRLGLPGLEWGQFRADRAGERVYAVRDWILFQWNQDWVWPNFNIADSLLVAGAAMLLIQAFLFQQSSDQVSGSAKRDANAA